MKKSTKAKTSGRFLPKILLFTLIVLFIIFVVVYARAYWQKRVTAKSKMQGHVQRSEKKLESEQPNEQITNANSNTQVDMRAYTNAQVKDAYLLVRMAAISVQQDHNVEMAKQLMQLASEHLADLNGPQIIQARNIVNADLSKLNAVPMVDKGAMQTKIANLDKLINVMPVARANTIALDPPTVRAKPAAEKPAWYQGVVDFFGNLKGLIKISKKSDQDVTVTDVELARGQFRLLIEQLRWAAFYNNADVYQRSIAQARALLPKIFDMQSESVQQFANSLQELQQIQLHTYLPDLQNSVKAMHAIIGG